MYFRTFLSILSVVILYICLNIIFIFAFHTPALPLGLVIIRKLAQERHVIRLNSLRLFSSIFISHVEQSYSYIISNKLAIIKLEGRLSAELSS